MNAEARCFSHGMGGLGSGDEQLARHAAHARAGGAILAAFNNHRARSGGFGGTVSNKSCRARTDNCNIHLQGFHALSSMKKHSVTLT